MKTNPAAIYPTVVALILNWNGRADTLACLQSLQQQTYPALLTLVVDNGSGDDSVAAIRAAFPDVNVIETGANLGFCVGNNVGLEWALAHRADYVLLLNNDTWFDPAMTSELVAAASADAAIGLAGPKIYQAAPPNVLWSAGGLVTFWGNVTVMRGFGQADRQQYDRATDVDYLPGCGILARRQLLETVGLLDPSYFAYYEDADWAMRARLAGWKVRYVPSAQMWHKGGASTGGFYNPREKYLSGVNAVRFMRRYAHSGQWALYLTSLAVGIPWLLMREGMRGRSAAVRAKIRGLVDGFRHKS